MVTKFGDEVKNILKDHFLDGIQSTINFLEENKDHDIESLIRSLKNIKEGMQAINKAEVTE